MAISRRKYRQMWLRYHSNYEKRAYKPLIKVFRSWAKDIDFDSMTLENFETIINQAIKADELSDVYLEIYTRVGLVHGSRVGKSINEQTKDFTFDSFKNWFNLSIHQYFNTYGVNRITSVQETFFNDIVKLLETRLERGLTLAEASKEVFELVNSNSFYRWQALRIARTETTAAANYGALQAGNVSNLVMDKEWLSSTDSRTRRTPPNEYDHLEMDGVRIPADAEFIFNNGMDTLMYPGDPTGEGGNVINCRCAIAMVPRRDADGRLIRK